MTAKKDIFVPQVCYLDDQSLRRMLGPSSVYLNHQCKRATGKRTIDKSILQHEQTLSQTLSSVHPCSQMFRPTTDDNVYTSSIWSVYTNIMADCVFLRLHAARLKIFLRQCQYLKKPKNIFFQTEPKIKSYSQAGSRDLNLF